MKRRRLVVLTFLVIASVLTAFSASIYIPQYYRGLAYAASDAKASTVDRELVAANTRFALNIFRELAREDLGKNVFISPLSISTALSMAYNGAGGSTKDAMAKILEFGSLDLENVNQGVLDLMGSLENADASVRLSIGNSVWMDKVFEPKVFPNFTQRMRTYFDGEVFARSFNNSKTVDEINGWIKDQTNGKIDKMIEEIDPGWVMFLVNAIYFKGDWVTKFDKSKTRSGDFHLPGGATVQTDFMYALDKFSYYSENGLIAVRLPYGRDKIAMYVFMPVGDSSLEPFIENLTQTSLNSYMSKFTDPRSVVLQLPKFKMEYGVKRLNNALIKMGMGVAFNPFEANFRGVASEWPLYVAFVDHKAVIEVNEEGTEAAAATNVVIEPVGMPTTIVFDRPFFYVIRDDRSGSILFMGKMVNPLQTTVP